MKKLARQVIFYSALLGLWTLLAKLHIWPPVSVSATVGRRPRIVGRLRRPQLLDRHCGNHEAHADRLQLVGRARNDFGTGCFEQQISGRDIGRVAGEPAVAAEYLLDSAGRALVRPDGEGNSVCRA